MFEKIINIFSSPKIKRTTGKKITKKSLNFFDDKKGSSFKKRKNNIFLLGGKKQNNVSKINNKLFITSFIACFFIGAVLFLVFGPYLKISNIYIYRQDSIINIDQAYGSADYIRGENILFLNTNEIALRLQKAQKSISNISFDIDFPNTINIDLGSYPALFQTDDYLILSNGVVVSKNSKEYVGIPLIETSKDIQENVIFGEALNIDDLQNLNTLLSEGKKNILGFDFIGLKYYITEKELLVMHSSGSIFIFNLDQNIEEQIEKLAIYNKEQGSIYEKKYIYVDVRIPEKLFLCPVESENNCRNNLEYIYGDTVFNYSLPEVSEPLQSDLQSQSL